MLSGIGPAAIWQSTGHRVVPTAAERRQTCKTTLNLYISDGPPASRITLYNTEDVFSKACFIGAQWLFYENRHGRVETSLKVDGVRPGQKRDQNTRISSIHTSAIARAL